MMSKVWKTGPVRHVLVGRLRADTTDDKFRAFIQAFWELTCKIDGIISFEYGANNRAEGLNPNLTHVITLTFTNAEARDAYLPHPAHRQFVEWFSPMSIVEELLVIDYIPQQ